MLNHKNTLLIGLFIGIVCIAFGSNTSLKSIRQPLFNHVEKYFSNMHKACSTNNANSLGQHRVQIVSHDPLIMYIHDFLDKSEISHLLSASEGRFETSQIYPGNMSNVNTKARISESAALDPDHITERIKARAKHFRGWRDDDSVVIQDLKTQRYGVGGYYAFHYDWDGQITEGNRVATFMVYVNDNCTGGGTNFPMVERPRDPRWCEILECEEDDSRGVTFKPVAGSAVFWENMHLDGTPRKDVLHASLPVTSGEKVGLNLWFWDFDWKSPAPKLEA